MDDEHWTEALRGREVPGAQPRTLAEAREVRAAVRAQESAPEDDPARGLAQLLARLKGDGLLDQRRAAWRFRPAYALAAAFALAALALPVVLYLYEPAEPELQTRGIPAPALRVTSEDPRKSAAELGAALGEAGATVSTRESQGRIQLEAVVPENRLVDAQKVFNRFGVAGKARRHVRIDIEPKAGKP
jgi:hypothetical protein